MTTKYMSPKGTAGYPKLTRPDTKFKAEGEYSVSLTMDAKDGAAFLDTLKEAAVEELGNKAAQAAVYPVKEEDGKFTFKFKMNAVRKDKKTGELVKQSPKLYDSHGKPIKKVEDLNIGSGSVMKVAGILGFPKVQGKQYVSLYMNQVQIIDLVEYVGSPFGDEGDGFSSDNDSAEAEEDQDVAF